MIVFREFRNYANERMKEFDEPVFESIESLRIAILLSVLKQILDFFMRFAVITGCFVIADK